MMSTYTCIACRVVFADGETQRTHYKTDWHRYNLKRKVADLSPVSTENFRLRVLNAQQTQVPVEKAALSCTLCGKHFKNENQMKNHCRSRKHRDIEAQDEEQRQQQVQATNDNNIENDVEAGEKKPKDHDAVNQALKESLCHSAPTGGSLDGNMGHTGAGKPDSDIDDDGSDVESVDSFDSADGLGIEECLFCSFVSGSLEENVAHMTAAHSFFLPDAEYVSDLEGLITYLGEKVGAGYMCLWCNEKGRCFHSAKAAQQHMVDMGHCKLLHDGEVVYEYSDYYDYRSSYPDHEEVGGAGGDDGDMEVAREDRHMEDVGPQQLAAEGYELVLPSGATVGHRSLAKYYRQNINPRHVDGSRSILPRMLAQYKALGWTGATGVTAVRRVKDLGAMQRMKTRHFMRLGIKANKFQPHLRPQVVF